MTEKDPRRGAQMGNPGSRGAAPPGAPATSARPTSEPASSGAATSGVATTVGVDAAGVDAAGVAERGRIKRGMVSGAWVGLIVSALVLVLLIIFIAQNLDETPIHFFGVSGQFPIGLSLLIAAIAGVVLAGIPGSIRIFQLRRALRKATGSAKKPRESKRAG